MTWKTVALGDVCELYQPKTISTKEMVDDGAYVVFGANGVIGRYDQYNHEEPQLLITCRGATCGAVNVSTPKAWINGNAMVVRPKGNDIDLRFLEYLFRGGVDLSRTITGAAQPQITRQTLAPLVISYPTSLPEQQRIVTKLDAAFRALREAEGHVERNRANARELFESYLNGVFEGNEGWEETTLEDVAHEDCSLSYGIVQPGEEQSDGMPVVRPVDLTSKVITLAGLKRIDPSLARGYKRTELQGGELLLCVRGDTGGVAIASNELRGANVTRGIVPIRFKGALRPDFAYYLMISPFVQGQIKEKTYGTTLMQINIGDLRKVRVTFPDGSEQVRLVKELEAMDNHSKQLEATYQQKLRELEGLKKGLLGAAFRGEL